MQKIELEFASPRLVEQSQKSPDTADPPLSNSDPTTSTSTRQREQIGRKSGNTEQLENNKTIKLLLLLNNNAN